MNISDSSRSGLRLMVPEGDQPLPQPRREFIPPTATPSFRTRRRPVRLTQYCKKLATHGPASSFLTAGSRRAPRHSPSFTHRYDATAALRHSIASLAGVRLADAAHAAHSKKHP